MPENVWLVVEIKHSVMVPKYLHGLSLNGDKQKFKYKNEPLHAKASINHELFSWLLIIIFCYINDQNCCLRNKE